jgi:PKD repeat protein
MKNNLLGKIFLLIVLTISSFSGLKSQDIVWRDTFRQFVPATAAQITKWNNFRASLVSTNTYIGMTISGTNNTTGLSHSDRTVATDFATALRNLTNYTSPSVNGNVWTLCNRYQGEVWVNPPATCSGSNCPNPGYIIRPGIGTGNSNWGGINTATCGGTNQWMELRFRVQPPLQKDAGVTAVIQPDKCVFTQDVRARFRNFGRTTLDSFQYFYNINGTTVGPVWRKIRLAASTDTVLTVVSNYSYTANTNYNISVWTDRPDNRIDSFKLNDTSRLAFRFSGTKGVPNGIDTSVCGSQSLLLRAIPDKVGDSLVWYSDRALTKRLGVGKNYRTALLPSGIKHKFYVSSYSDFEKGALFMQYTLTNGWPSSMFDIRALGEDLTIDSMGLNIYDFNFGVGTSLDVEVYLREGSFSDPGATTNSSMWKKIYTGPVISRGSTKRSTLFCSFDIKGGKTYGVYINPTQTGSNTILVKPSAQTIVNGDIQVTGGTINQINFGTVLNGYTLDGEIFYKKLLCKSAPDSVTADVKPAPFGAKLTPGTPFQTSPKKSGSGAKGLPHVVALGDTLALDLMEPTGYTNSTHSTSWKVASVVMKTATGRSITGYSWTDPTSSAAGRLKFSPNSTEIDSQLVAEVRIQDLGPYFCDTVLTHYLYVAPLPQPGFTRTSRVCEGDVVEFKNSTKIESGFLDYKWYFGDGDSSEAVDPFHFYPGAGVYYAKLDAISSIYGYVRSKLDTITITRLPKVDFKVFNVCEKQTHRFVNNTTATGTVTYKWNFGTAPGVQSTVKDPTFKYSAPGQYKVTLTAEANGCPATLVKNAYLFPTPKAAFTYPNAPGTKFCSNVPVEFTNQTTILSGNVGGKWLFGDGSVGTVRNTNHTFTSGGTYNVQYIAISDFGCSDTARKTIEIGSAPVVSWSNGQVCDQTPTQFTNNTPAISGFTSSPAWTFGDGNKSGADNPNHQYTVLGPKTVKLVVSVNNGCKDSLEKTVNVGTQAIVDFAVSNTCSGQPVQFDNKTTWKQGNIVYEWDFGDGSPLSNASDPLHIYTTATSFAPNVKLRAIVDGACESIVTKPLQVFQLPSCAFTITDDWTPGEGFRTVKVQAANTTYPFYRFKFSDGGSINASSGVYQFPYEGDFTVTLYARNAADCECNTSQLKAIRNSVGVENLKGGEVRLFPNPSTGLVNIEAGSQIKSVEVYNVLGEAVVVSQTMKAQTGVLKFNGLSDGVYLVKVTTTDGITTQRITLSK